MFYLLTLNSIMYPNMVFLNCFDFFFSFPSFFVFSLGTVNSMDTDHTCGFVFMMEGGSDWSLDDWFLSFFTAYH